MNNSLGVETKPRFFYGWWLVLAGFALLAYGDYAESFMRRGLSALAFERSGSPALLGIVSTISALLVLTSILYLLAIGPLIDKYGPKKIMLIGIPIAGIGFIILGFANSTVTFLVLQGTLLSWGMAAGFGLTVHTAVANWFRKRRTIAFAIISAAVVLPGFFTPTQAYNTIIEQFSRQGTFIGLGSLMLMIGIPLALLFRHRPEQHGYLPNGQEPHTKLVDTTIPIEQNHMTEVNLTLRQALRSRAFWLLAVALTLESLVVSISSAVRVEYQVDFMGKSGLALVEDNIWWGIFSLIGILLFGLLGDKFSKRHLLAAAVILRCISFVVLLSVGSVQWYMNGLLFYMGAGIPVLTYAIIADYFGRRSFATIVAFSSVIRLIIMIPVVGGLWFPFRWLFEISGSYYPIIVVAVVVGILSAVLFLFLKPPQVNPQGEIVTDIP